jgi:hypothetical protein
MFCRNCGVLVKEGSEFCGNCGTKINRNNYLQEMESEDTKTASLDEEVIVLLNDGDLLGTIDYYELSSGKNYEESCLYVAKLDFNRRNEIFTQDARENHLQEFKEKIKEAKLHEKKSNIIFIFLLFLVGGIIIGIIGAIQNSGLLFIGLGCWLFGIIGVYWNRHKKN